MMLEPYSDEHAEIAQNILGKAVDELIAAGFGYVEACHSLIKMGLDSLPGGACKACLEGEYDAVADAVEKLIDEIPDLVPGRDVAVGPCDQH